jgi:hypothetical protein
MKELHPQLVLCQQLLPSLVSPTTSSSNMRCLMYPTVPAACVCRTRLLLQNTGNKCPQPSYSTVCYTPKGLAYYSDW